MNARKDKIKKIHFVGVKGVGMTPLAIIAKEAGLSVSGCDVAEKFITDDLLNKAKVKVYDSFSTDHIKNVDLIVSTGAHGGLLGPEVTEARKQSIPVLSQGEALAQFQTGEFFDKESFGISVAGSHGKTTTTAMIATILKANNLDPSFSIGTGFIPYLESSGHFGQGQHFVVEADEYVVDAVSDRTPKFLLQKPNMIVITNIDFDHPDIYPSIKEVREAFLQFADRLQSGGKLIVNGDGQKNRDFIHEYKENVITYGLAPDNELTAEKISYRPDQVFFWAKRGDVLLGEFVLNVFGEHNVLNALAAIAACLELGLSVESIKAGLTEFKGTKRRSELIGTTSEGALVYDDYAHHPQEISKTLKSFRQRFPNKKIICIFQPHMYSRTKALLGDFIASFVDADEVVVAEIFPSFREEKDPNFSAKSITDGINQNRKTAVFVGNLSDVIKYMDQNPPSKDSLVITMGAGDIYKVAHLLVKNNE